MVSNGQKVDSEVFDAETFILLLNWPCFVMLSFTYLNSEIVYVLDFFTTDTLLLIRPPVFLRNCMLRWFRNNDYS